jgi:hypothetical protein
MPILAAGESSVVAGAYKASWNGLDIGDITPDGYELSWQPASFDIYSDAYGEATKLDSIYQGMSLSLSFTIQHWNARAVEQIIWWMGNQGDPAGYKFGTVGGAGLRHWDAAKPLLLESCALDDMGALPATAANQTIDPLDITFPKALLSNDQAVRMLMAGSRPRYIPITMEIFPVAPTESGETYLDPADASRPAGCSDIVFFDATRNAIQPTPDAIAAEV